MTRAGGGLHVSAHGPRRALLATAFPSQDLRLCIASGRRAFVSFCSAGGPQSRDGERVADAHIAADAMPRLTHPRLFERSVPAACRRTTHQCQDVLPLRHFHRKPGDRRNIDGIRLGTPQVSITFFQSITSPPKSGCALLRRHCHHVNTNVTLTYPVNLTLELECTTLDFKQKYSPMEIVVTRSSKVKGKEELP